MFFTQSNGIVTAAISLSLSVSAAAFAQQIPDSAGVVRITDGRTQSGVQPASGQQIQQTSTFHGHWGGPVYSEPPMTNSSCPSGNCPSNGQYGVGQYGSGQYGPYSMGGGCPSGNCPHYRGGLHGCFAEQYCKHSPDYGYSPPAKYPLNRRGVEYTNYYPTNWYGTGPDFVQSSAPMVYQPTDTTQLGFYYQHVPFWQPQPSRLPERPIPAQWHIRAPAVAASGFSNGYTPYIGPGPHFPHRRTGYYSNGFDMTGSCPVDASTGNQFAPPQVMSPEQVVPSIQPVPRPIETGTPAALPAGPESPESDAMGPSTNIPPSPAQQLPTSSATSGHIRRIGSQN